MSDDTNDNHEELASPAATSYAYSLWRDGSGDLLLSLVSYLNVRDGNRLAATCRRAYYWDHQYRRLRGPVARRTSFPKSFVLVKVFGVAVRYPVAKRKTRRKRVPPSKCS